MIRKYLNYNRPFEGAAPDASYALEKDGHVILPGVFDSASITALREEIEGVFDLLPGDERLGCMDEARKAMFRYEMFNRSALAQQALSHPRMLEVVEPLLGDDCHVIANTVWRNPADREHAPNGQQWHVDGGPYLARPPGTPWPENIDYPIFVITAHVYLEAVGIADGPTAVLPGSHRSGGLPPHERMWDTDLTYEGRVGEMHLVEPGDVSMFVSDTWHRRMPLLEDNTGRFFMQVVYARREIAQRIVPSERCNPASAEARERAQSLRERQLIGIHDPGFYDG